MNLHHKTQGFTLAELLVTMVIMGLLATLAFPSFMDYLRGQEAKRTIEGIRPLFIEARSVALTRRQHVVICPTANKTTCDKTASTLMSFMDTNANKVLDSDEPILSYINVNLRFGELKFNMSANRKYIRYYPDTGKPRGHFGNVTYCPDNGDMTFAKAIVLNEHGRARISFDKNGDGVDERGGGRALRC